MIHHGIGHRHASLAALTPAAGNGRFRQVLRTAVGLWLCVHSGLWAAASEPFPLIDTHIHYSHDARSLVSPEKAVEILRAAGLERAFVSSSGDEGTRMLYQADPDLVVPVLRPYRKRGELGTWMYDDTVPGMLIQRINKYAYAGIGEFHAFGEDLNLPVLRQVIAIARKHGLFLHAHTDARGVENIFSQYPEARVLWAHGGFEARETIVEMLGRYDKLWIDLSFRYEHESGGKVDAEWRRLFQQHGDRFTVGTDTYTPERWFEVKSYAVSSRKWLQELPEETARRIAYGNALDLVRYSGFGSPRLPMGKAVTIEERCR